MQLSFKTQKNMGKIFYIMHMEKVTRISLMEDKKVMSVSSNDPDMTYIDFMKMFERVVMSTRQFSKHEIESYITEWADRITDYKNN
jgi:hypothetical protein